MNKEGLDGLLIQATGLDKASKTLAAIRASFEALKRYADFEVDEQASEDEHESREEEQEKASDQVKSNLHLNLGYTINLNLPKSDDIAVFNAIFKALKEHLLTK